MCRKSIRKEIVCFILWLEDIVSLGNEHQLFHNNNLIFFSGVVDKNNIVDYRSFRKKYAAKGRGKDFQESILRIEEFIQDPVVCTNCYILLELLNNFIWVINKKNICLSIKLEISLKFNG